MVRYQVQYRMLILSVVFALVGTQVASAIPVTDSLFTRGNEYYMQRRYDIAEQYYTRIVELGYESAELYFNLGNAFYKQDKIGNAILYYEKALLLKPGDEDIKENLALANARIIDNIDAIPEFFVKRWVHGLQRLFSPDRWASICLILFVLSLVCFSVYYAGRSIGLKKGAFTSGVTLMLLSVVGITLMATRIGQIRKHKHAIIMMPSVNARSSPDEQSTNVFVLHEGTKIMVTNSVQGWKEIRIANGNTGWIPGESMEEI